ncbi:Hypothetical predicted protein [Cloeon dipterum]|uniref:Sushi domain-containing protein n=1 Tax=Cloeon dipterum TaxID=197152 RepID=A0A8S1CJ67_9INSE|nr:Hypothetical predicted protein [Cloeon dipterum]
MMARTRFLFAFLLIAAVFLACETRAVIESEYSLPIPITKYLPTTEAPILPDDNFNCPPGYTIESHKEQPGLVCKRKSDKASSETTTTPPDAQ